MLLFKVTFGYNLEISREPIVKQNAKVAIISTNKIFKLYKQLLVNIKFLNKQITYYTNKSRNQKLLFKKKNKVYLFCKNFKTKQLLDKLNQKKIGIYKVLEKVLLVNY